MNANQHIIQNMNTYLANFVRHLDRDDLRTVEALLIDLTGGNDAAARMLNRLIFWWPRAKKPGGWVYKSATDWYAECRLSRSKIATVHSKGILEAIGIERKNMKANGNPTIHYRLDVGQFLAALARFAGVAIEQVKAWMQLDMETNDMPESAPLIAEIDEEGSSENPHMVLQESGKSITKESQTTKTKQFNDKEQTNNTAAVVQDYPPHREKDFEGRLEDIPLLPRWLASQLVKEYDFEFVQAVSKYAAKQKSLSNPVGWVRSELKHNRLKLDQQPLEPTYDKNDPQRYVKGYWAELLFGHQQPLEPGTKSSIFDTVQV